MTFFHVGIVVESLEESMAEMSAALGIDWRTPHNSTYGNWNIRVVYSLQGPPYVELIQGELGGPWDTSKGSHIDHIGIWVDDVPTDSGKLLDNGIPMYFDPMTVAKPPTFAYHRADKSGITIEIVSSSIRERIENS